MFLRLIFLLLVFINTLNRIMRDMLIVASISAEALSLTKSLSFPFILLMGLLQNKFFLRMNLKKTFFYIISFFLLFQIAFFCKWIPNIGISKITYANHPHCTILFNLIEKLPNCLFYIFSEMFGVAISVNFWTLANRYNDVQANSYFILAQCGLFLAGGLVYFSTSIIQNIAIFVIPFLIILISIYLFDDNKKPKSNDKIIEIEPKFFQKKRFYFWLLPAVAFVVSISTGLFDAFFKAQLKYHYSDSEIFVQKIAQNWMLQAVFSSILGVLLKNNKFGNILTPITTLFFVIVIIFLLINGCDVLYITILSIVITKSLKYSTHSPTKEMFFRLLPFGELVKPYEGVAGKFGKQMIAFSTAILFSWGYSWANLQIPILMIIALCAIFWFILCLYIKIKRKE